MQTGIVPPLPHSLALRETLHRGPGFFSALDLLALAWLHRTVRQTVGLRAAFLAALLYALRPDRALCAHDLYQTLIASLATVAFGSLLVLLSPRPQGQAVALAMGSITALGRVHLAAAPWSAILMLLCVRSRGASVWAALS